LKVGDCTIADHITMGSARFETDSAWTGQLRCLLPDAKRAHILAWHEPMNAAQKIVAGLSRETNVVDMESGYAAKDAAERGVPFAALRVISDTVEQSLPPAAMVAIKPNGSIALGRVMASVLRNPLQIPALIRTGRESEKAFAALLRCVEVLGPGLGCPYLG